MVAVQAPTVRERVNMSDQMYAMQENIDHENLIGLFCYCGIMC